MVQINSSCGLFSLLNIYSCRFGFGGSPCCYAARCENLAHDLRNLWVRNQALPEIRNEIRKSKTWTNTKSSMVQDAQKCDAMRWTTCWPLARSSDRWIEVVICCDMDYENEHDGGPWLKWRLQLLPRFVRWGYVCRSWQELEEALSSHKAPERSWVGLGSLTVDYSLYFDIGWSQQLYFDKVHPQKPIRKRTFDIPGAVLLRANLLISTRFSMWDGYIRMQNLVQGPTTRIVGQHSPELQMRPSAVFHLYMNDSVDLTVFCIFTI